jgi:peptidoglycan/xylan/chitin deacetylase (PgdA/CDA1 family)
MVVLTEKKMDDIGNYKVFNFSKEYRMSIKIKNPTFPLLIFITSLIMFSGMHFVYPLNESNAKHGVLTKNIFKENGSNLGSCHCVAFRLDDVGDHYLTKTQIGVMNVFREKDVDLTIGIIGYNIGRDQKVVSSYIKERLKDNDSNRNNTNSTLELANHSWKHEHFENLTLDEQSNSIRKTSDKIKNTFGVTPTVFIAPDGGFNNNTFIALHENNMTYFSSDERDSSRLSTYSNSTIYHLPHRAHTGGCNACEDDGRQNRSWYGVQNEKTLDEINRSVSKYGFAVVVMHAMEYSPGHDEWRFPNAVDSKQIMELELLIDKVQQEGLQIVTIGNIINHFKIS